MNLNEINDELIALFKKAGVAEPEHPHLEWEIARQCWLFYDNSKSSFFERWFEQDHLVRDLLASHFERLWCGLDMDNSITVSKSRGGKVYIDVFDAEFSLDEPSASSTTCKLTAILLAMRSKYGGEDG